MFSLSNSGSGKRRLRRAGILCGTVLGVVVSMAGVKPAYASAGQSVSDLTTTTTATDLANTLVGSGVSVSNVTYTGADVAAGTFSGMGAIGFASGVVLGSGAVDDVVGPNSEDGKTTDNDTPGDSDLDALANGSTQDASVLEFDFVPTTSQITFDYVFSSEEYNEFANSQFNDVFAFLVNGKNCALTPDGDPVSINTINGGNPYGTDAKHPELFRNNERAEDGSSPIDAEPDGLTVVLSCDAAVNQGVTNHMKLAIADTGDAALDSNVFLKAGSFKANHAPVAHDGSVTTPQDTAKSVTLDATDADSDALTYSIGTGPSHGTLTGTGANRTYTPAAGYTGPDSFTFKANDGQADSNLGTVSITVDPVVTPPTNHPPVAHDGSATTAQDTAKGITLDATDADSDALTYSIGAGPSHGTLTGTGASRTYTPDAGYSGPDSFTFKANDGQADSNVATFSLTVTPVVTPPVNHAPVAHDGSATTPQDTAKNVTLQATDSDNDPLTYSVVAGPSHGTLTGTGANRTYTPAAGYSGADSFTFKANDGQVDSNVATFSLTVTPVKPAPTTHCAVGKGTVKPASGGKATSFAFTFSNHSKKSSGSATITTPSGTFKGSSISALTFASHDVKFTVAGKWKGVSGYKLVGEAVDGKPDSVTLTISKGAKVVFKISNHLATGKISIS